VPPWIPRTGAQAEPAPRRDFRLPISDCRLKERTRRLFFLFPNPKSAIGNRQSAIGKGEGISEAALSHHQVT